MDDIRSEESKQQAPQEPAAKAEPTRRRPRQKKAIPIPAFLTHLGQDVRWYYDIRLWSPLLLLILILALLPGKKQDPAVQDSTPDISAVETQPTEEQTEPTQEPVNEEAAALARLADSVGAGRSDNVKIIIMWVAINRSEDRANGYGQSLLDEIARPNQWQGYDENAPYSAGTYAMALDVLDTQARGGLRPLDPDMLWLVLNDDGSVTLRNRFTATANQKWREKTVK